MNMTDTEIRTAHFDDATYGQTLEIVCAPDAVEQLGRQIRSLFSGGVDFPVIMQGIWSVVAGRVGKLVILFTYQTTSALMKHRDLLLASLNVQGIAEIIQSVSFEAQTVLLRKNAVAPSSEFGLSEFQVARLYPGRLPGLMTSLTTRKPDPSTFALMYARSGTVSLVTQINTFSSLHGRAAQLSCWLTDEDLQNVEELHAELSANINERSELSSSPAVLKV
ncbi:hypothetical protein [Brucella gallinifaecis]|uniref:hypothetical protein n=1 Tax=Brucella gallinifaecis TaxID=215590 RepID=UPI00236149E2|nr:hypothetical protein [Brucella gallinifaecis]